jgi:tRNA-specific 2-thiouridylase
MSNQSSGLESRSSAGKQALVLYSGGLDSRLVVRILKDQGFVVECLYFNLPFGCGCCNLGCNVNFTQKEGVKVTVVDVTKDPLLQDYLSLVKDPQYGVGASINPCKDCKLFIFRFAGNYARKNGFDLVASGEVLGQRPMSQVKSAMRLIDEQLGFELLRPLSAQLLPVTSYERDGLVDREKLFGFSGRTRKPQMALAEEWGVSFPSPGGGCFLCEKVAAPKIKVLAEKGLLDERTLPLSMIGRHYFIGGVWFVVARDIRESGIIASFDGSHLPGAKGVPSVYFSSSSGRDKALELQRAFSTGASMEVRDSFSKYKL